MEQRVIKFRAWHEGHPNAKYPIPAQMLFDTKPGDCLVYQGQGQPVTVMQFTGLLDKNGTEIYEGDILSVCNGSINGAPWMDKPYAVSYHPFGKDLPRYCWENDGTSAMDSTHWCEVIGNIYQNPELIPS